MSDDLAMVRRVLLRELETINEYEEMARAAASPQAREFFLHLAKEEKEHVAEATFLIRQLDPDQDAVFKAGVAPGHFGGAAQPSGGPPSPLQDLQLPGDPKKIFHALPAPPTGGQLTVGPLKRRP